jgi:hypothetical protein
VTRDGVAAGLCADCRHARRIANRRGSVFLLCDRAATDPRYLRYPPLPVIRCPGHEPGPPPPESPDA